MWWVFAILWKMFSKKIVSQIPWFFFLEKVRHYCLQYDMKGCLRFYSFIFWISSNSAKYTYGLSPLEQQRKIEKNNIDAHAHTHTHTHIWRERWWAQERKFGKWVDGAQEPWWLAGMETTTRGKVWKKGVSLFFLALYIYSQKDKIQIKISKIKCFLRFSVARIPPKFK